MAKIVCICTYPVTIPRHGGQIRVDAIERIYRSAGHEVRHLAIYRDNFYPDEPPSPWNVHFTPSFVNSLTATDGRDDVNASDFPLNDVEVQNRIRGLLRDFEPDVIQLEHCWMWPMVKALRSQVAALRTAKIVYSSQNVEFALLQHSAGGGDAGISSRVVDLVRRMEMDLVRTADLVATCSRADADAYQLAAPKVVLAPNGIWPKPPVTGEEYWRKELSGRRLALFVGSAHPPNAAGFVGMLGPHLGFLSPTERIVVVGGVCNLLSANPLFQKHMGLNLARSVLLGTQDPGGLSMLIDVADVILVPILEGGGTNIKMAEAIYNRKLVICTRKATRGYEAFLDSPLVMVRDTPEEFRSTLVEVLRGQKRPVQPTRADVHKLRGLLWSSTLAPLADALEEVLRQPSKTA